MRRPILALAFVAVLAAACGSSASPTTAFVSPSAVASPVATAPAASLAATAASATIAPTAAQSTAASFDATQTPGSPVLVVGSQTIVPTLVDACWSAKSPSGTVVVAKACAAALLTVDVSKAVVLEGTGSAAFRAPEGFVFAPIAPDGTPTVYQAAILTPDMVKHLGHPAVPGSGGATQIASADQPGGMLSPTLPTKAGTYVVQLDANLRNEAGYEFYGTTWWFVITIK
jgi:hypothetical protein